MIRQLLKVGDKVTFHGSPIQDIPAADGEFVIEKIEPAGNIFNQPMLVLKDTTWGWMPIGTVRKVGT